jgi:hypothetical protein
MAVTQNYLQGRFPSMLIEVTMKIYQLTLLNSYMLLSLLTTGCASISGWDTKSASSDFVDGTRVLAEVVMIATRHQVISNDFGNDDSLATLISAGYTDNDIVDGSVVTVWSYCFGHNSGVHICRHTGHYIAHVPLELREGLQDSPAWDTTGDLVEVELTKTPTGYLVGKVVTVYRKSEDWSPCRRAEYQPTSELSNAFLSLTTVGPPRAIWIECENLEGEGWVRRPVRGAPPSKGPPISEWVKIPQ